MAIPTPQQHHNPLPITCFFLILTLIVMVILPTSVNASSIMYPRNEYHIAIDYQPQLANTIIQIIDGRFGGTATKNPCVYKDSTYTIQKTAFALSYHLPEQKRIFLRILTEKTHIIESLQHIFVHFDKQWPKCLAWLTGIGISPDDSPTTALPPGGFFTTPLEVRVEQLKYIHDTHSKCTTSCGSHPQCLCEKDMQCPLALTLESQQAPHLPQTYHKSCISPYTCIGTYYRNSRDPTKHLLGTCFVSDSITDYSLTRIYLDFTSLRTRETIITLLQPYVSSCMVSPSFVFANVSNSTLVIYGTSTLSMRSSPSCSLTALNMLARSSTPGFKVVSLHGVMEGFDVLACTDFQLQMEYRSIDPSSQPIQPLLPNTNNSDNDNNDNTGGGDGQNYYIKSDFAHDVMMVNDSDDFGNGGSYQPNKKNIFNKNKNDIFYLNTDSNTILTDGNDGNIDNEDVVIGIIPGRLHCGIQTGRNCTQVKCPIWSPCSSDIDCIYGLCLDNMCQLPDVTTEDPVLTEPKIDMFYPKNNAGGFHSQFNYYIYTPIHSYLIILSAIAIIFTI